jgi:integrase
MPNMRPMPKSSDPTKRCKTRYRGISYRQRKDGTRQYSVYHHGRYVAVEGGEQEALVLQGDLRRRAARGERVVAPARLTVAVVAEEYIDAKKNTLRAGTWRTYRSTLDRILIPKFGDLKIGAVTVKDVRLLIRELKRSGLTPATIHAYLMPLRGVLAYAVAEYDVPGNPCDKLSRDDRPRDETVEEIHVWSDTEIEALIEAAERMARQAESRYDYAPLIRTALYTGLRLGELLGLQWQDVDLHEGVLHVRRQWTRMYEYGPPKTRAGFRRLPLSDEMKQQLAELKLRSRYSGDSDPIFPARNGRPLGHRNVTRRGFEPAAEKAGIEGVTFHDMRHAFASRMISRGISSTVLAKLMGHESSAITEKVYVHLFDQVRTDDAVREAMDSATV